MTPTYTPGMSPWTFLAITFIVVIGNLLQVWLQERIRKRQTGIAREEIATSVANRLTEQTPATPREGKKK